MNDDRLKKLGLYIKLLRESEGLSQEQLAKKSGFAGRAAISAIENGKNNISVEKLPDLALSLHTTPGKLLDVMVESSSIEESDRLFTLIKLLNPEEQSQVEQFIKFIISNRGGKES